MIPPSIVLRPWSGRYVRRQGIIPPPAVSPPVSHHPARPPPRVSAGRGDRAALPPSGRASSQVDALRAAFFLRVGACQSRTAPEQRTFRGQPSLEAETPSALYTLARFGIRSQSQSHKSSLVALNGTPCGRSSFVCSGGAIANAIALPCCLAGTGAGAYRTKRHRDGRKKDGAQHSAMGSLQISICSWPCGDTRSQLPAVRYSGDIHGLSTQFARRS